MKAETITSCTGGMRFKGMLERNQELPKKENALGDVYCREEETWVFSGIEWVCLGPTDLKQPEPKYLQKAIRLTNCKNCGAPLPSGSHSCVYCGTPFLEVIMNDE